MKKLGRKKPQKVIKRPLNPMLAMFYDLANSRRFEIAIFVLIFLNMLSMGIEHFGQPDVIFFLLEVSNAFFTTVFGLECIVKIIGKCVDNEGTDLITLKAPKIFHKLSTKQVLFR